MGLNTNVCVVKKVSSANSESFIEHLQPLSTEYQDAEFSFILSEINERNPEPLVAVSQIQDFWIVIDDYHDAEGRLINYSKVFKTELLQAENSDTTGICSFSFYNEGKLIRKVSLGIDHWIDEMKEMEMDEMEREAILSSISEAMEEIGTELEMERNGSDALSVLKAYALDYDDFYKLSWTRYKVGV
jgi:hypothetical protein